MSESFREQVERVIEMSRDDGKTWDLSPNDQAALKGVLLRMSELDAQVQEAQDIIRAIIYASDGCVGHRDCAHSMEPWQRARALVYRIDDGPDPADA